MGSKSIVALVALACAAALGFFLLSDGGPEREDQTVARGDRVDRVDSGPAGEVTLDPAVSGAAGTGTAAARATLEAEVVDVDAAAHPWREMLAGVTGRVVEEDGTPVIGMRVELLEGDASLMLDPQHTPMGRENIDVDETKTGADGRFTIEGATITAFHVLALDSGGGRATIRFVEQGLESGELTDVGDIVLPKYGTVIGTVLDEDGEPVAGARVRLAPIPEPVLQSGVLDLRDDCIIAFGKDDFETVDIPHWIMANMDRLPVPTTTTAADGTFRLEGVPLTVVAGGVDRGGYVATIIDPFEMNVAEYDLEEIDLEVGRVVTGRVIDKLGDPVANAEVRAGALHPVFTVGILQSSILTDDDGQFEVPGISDLGQVVATARRDARQPWVNAMAGGGSSTLNVVLPAAAPLTVRASNEAGEPVEGARITLRTRPEERGMMSMGITSMLGTRARPATYRVAESEPGVYVVEDLGLGRWVVRVEADAHAPTEAEVQHSSESTLCDVTCKGGRTINVLAVDQATGEPVRNAHARIIGPSEALFGAYASKFTDETGMARLGPIARPGEEATVNTSPFPVNFGMQVTVEHPRYGFFAVELPSEGDDVTVELTPACTLNGRITWAGSAPADVYMLALVREDKGVNELSMAFSTPRTTLSNLEGTFKFTGLSAGRYNLSVLRRFLDKDPFEFIIKQQEPEQIYRTDVEVVVGEENLVEVVLEADGEGPKSIFAGRIIVEGEAVVGAKVSINGKEDQTLETNGLGEFESEPVPAIGWYNVEIEGEIRLADGSYGKKTLYDEWQQPDSSGVTRIDIDIDYEPLVVEVTDAVTGAFVPDLWVAIDNGDSVQTGADGRAEVLIERTGDQNVRVNGEGYVNYSKSHNCDPTAVAPQIRVALTPSVPCAGQVVLPSGQTVTDDWIGLMVTEKGSNEQNWHQVNKEDLTFTINGMSPGSFSARLWTGGSQSSSVEFDLGPNGDSNLVLQFNIGD